MHTTIIAEICQAHEGSLGILHSYIDAVAATGADVIKFQTHIADAESSIQEPFRVKFSYEDNTRMDYWRRMEFTKEQWVGIKKHCEEVGLEFLSSPFSLAAVDLLEEIGVQRYKIGSGEVSNFLILEKIARTGKPILISSGMSSFEELDETITFLKPFNVPISLFQCNTQYPTPPENVGLNVIPQMMERYGLPIGLSDHSAQIYPAIAAVAMGASLIEVHTVFSKQMFGPDATSSLTLEQLKDMVDGIRFIEKSFNNPTDKTDISRFKKVKSIFEKSLAVNKDLPKGHILVFEDLESKKPANQGISTKRYREVIGKKLSKDFKKWDFLKEQDLDD